MALAGCRIRLAAVVVAVAGLVGAGTVRAGTVYVSPAGNDTNDGLSWGTAKKTVQAGLNAAASGDQVWVAGGLYLGTITLKTEVGLYGGFAGKETQLGQRDWVSNETILDGNQAGSVVTVPPGATQATRIDGLAIRNGKAVSGGGIYCSSSSSVTITNSIITDNIATGTDQGLGGGGIYCGADCSPTITNDTITNNKASGGWGGGIYCGNNAGPTITNNTILYNFVGTSYGGGIFCDAYSAATIRDNTITYNMAGFAAGIGCVSSSVTITGNAITYNTATWSGGGICCKAASPAITSNTITGNAAPTSGGGIYCTGASPMITNNSIAGNRASSPGCGGGIACDNSSSPRIANNSITGNSGYYFGGGIYCNASSSPTITSNTIAGNTVANGSGGGIHCSNASPRIVGNTITGNVAIGTYGSGGGICCYPGSSPIVTNNAIAGNSGTYGGGIDCESTALPKISNDTIVGNNASSLGGGIYCESTSPPITNTIVAFNSSGIYKTGSGTLSLRCNCVYGSKTRNYSGLTDPTGTNGNISKDPLFVSASPGPDGIWGTADDVYGDLRLLPGSPCIDAGSNADVPADGADLNGNGNTTEPLPFDLAGNPRFVDDPTAVDTGAGTAPIVDIGAYERQHLAGDVNGDWQVDVVDLLYLLDAFGSVTGDANYDAACDFNTDGSVDVVDLLTMVESFGK